MHDSRFPVPACVPSLALAALGLAAALTLGALPAQAADAEAGKAKAAEVCQSCHGEDGNGMPGNPLFPKLAGQYEDYLLHTLKAYANGERRNAIMQGIVGGLSEEDMENLAAYYAGLDGQLANIRYTK